ncbi:MAG: hypothetical protein K2P84_01480 [Undibacterium sp.]|nr:hypothetical protein [Undibacterium sp.]
MKKISICSTLIFLAFVLSGCISVKLEPEKLVSDGVNASKQAYKSYKYGKDGKVEREFTHSLMIEKDQTKESTSSDCLKFLNQLVASKSADGKAQIVSESTRFFTEKTEHWVGCSVKAMI